MGLFWAVIHILFAGDLRRGTEAGTGWNNIWAIYSQGIRRLRKRFALWYSSSVTRQLFHVEQCFPKTLEDRVGVEGEGELFATSLGQAFYVDSAFQLI